MSPMASNILQIESVLFKCVKGQKKVKRQSQRSISRNYQCPIIKYRYRQ